MELGCAVVPIKEINLVLKTLVLLEEQNLVGRIYLCQAGSPWSHLLWVGIPGCALPFGGDLLSFGTWHFPA